jgi:hypothetical protein
MISRLLDCLVANVLINAKMLSKAKNGQKNNCEKHLTVLSLLRSLRVYCMYNLTEYNKLYIFF